MGVPTVSFEMTGAQPVAVLSGEWTLTGLRGRLDTLRRQLASADAARAGHWDLREVTRLDSLGATTLWRAWGDRLPERLEADPHTLDMLRAAAVLGPCRPAPRMRPRRGDTLVALGRLGGALVAQLLGMIALSGQILFDAVRMLRFPQDAPLRELSANLYKTGVTALPITALVGFLIGVVLSYLSALQLKTFGADVFIINILGIGIIRELGPVLVAVLVAGRSGSAMTAQIGVMRVTEEIDALATMGISRTQRLVLPKIAALTTALPLLVLWTSAAGILGGMVSANLQLGLAYGFFLDQLPKAVPLANLWIGLAKGWVFGLLISLIACYFGLHVKPNTESLSARTTASVVTAITTVILADALLAIATREIGMPK